MADHEFPGCDGLGPGAGIGQRSEVAVTNEGGVRIRRDSVFVRMAEDRPEARERLSRHPALMPQTQGMGDLLPRARALAKRQGFNRWCPGLVSVLPGMFSMFADVKRMAMGPQADLGGTRRAKEAGLRFGFSGEGVTAKHLSPPGTLTEPGRRAPRVGEHIERSWLRPRAPLNEARCQGR